MAAVQGAISKRRKFVADGVFYAELNEFFQRELAEEGYSGVEVRVTPTVTDISTSHLPNFSFVVESHDIWLDGICKS
jgi:small subunit ribosomal protein S3e